MPFGLFANGFPTVFFLLLHLVGLLLGAYFSYRAFGARLSHLGWGFMLYALAEIAYVAYNVDVLAFLFAHTLGELLDLAAIAFIFSGAVRFVPIPARRASAVLVPAEPISPIESHSES